MAFGVYFGARPSELTNSTEALQILKLPAKNLELALISDPSRVRDMAQEILRSLRSDRTAGLDAENILRGAVASWTDALATRVLTQNDADVSQAVDQAFKCVQTRAQIPTRVCAQAIRMKAREAVKLGNVPEAMQIFDQVLRTEFTSALSHSKSAARIDRIEKALLALCVDSVADPLDPEAIRHLTRESSNFIKRELAKIDEELPEVVEKVLPDLLWLVFTYARVPLQTYDPLLEMCEFAFQQLSAGLGPDRAELEAYRLSGALALEQGEFERAGELFRKAYARAVRMGTDAELERIEFLHAEGEALALLGGRTYERALGCLHQAHHLAQRDSDTVLAFYYALQHSEVLIRGWQLDRVSIALPKVHRECWDDAGPVLRAQFLCNNATLAAMEGNLELSASQVSRAVNELGSSECDEAKGGPQVARIVARLNQLKFRESWPIRIAAIELHAPCSSREEISLLDGTLSHYVARDRSPWIAELLLRLDLASARWVRTIGVEQVTAELLKRPTALIMEFPKLKESVLLAELLLERGLQLIAAQQIDDAKQALNGAASTAEHFGVVGYSVEWAARFALSKLYPRGKQLAAEQATRMGEIEVAVRLVAECAQMREFLDHKYSLSALFK